MQHEERLAQLAEAIFELVHRDVVEKLLADSEWPAGERDLHLALRMDLVDLLLEQPRDVAGIGPRADRFERAHLGALRGRNQHRGATEAMADQDRGGLVGLAQMFRRRD